MNITRAYLIATLGSSLALAASAQAPPPPAAGAVPPPPAAMAESSAGSVTTHSSRVSAVVYGPQGEEQAFVLRDGVSVSLPPDLGMRLQSAVIKGTRIRVTGTQQTIAGQRSLVAQSITANGQNFVADRPSPDAGPLAAAPPPSPLGLRGPGIERRGPRPGGPPPPPQGPGAPGMNVPPPPPAGDLPAPPAAEQN